MIAFILLISKIVDKEWNISILNKWEKNLFSQINTHKRSTFYDDDKETNIFSRFKVFQRTLDCLINDHSSLLL